MGKLPQNFKLVQNNGSITWHKIGDNFLSDSGFLREYYRYDGYGKFDYFSESEGVFVQDGKREFGDFFDRMYGLNWTKTGDTKEVAGVNCVKYTNPTDASSYMYVFEETGLIFEQGLGTTRMVYTTEYDPSVTAFPITVPN